MNKLASMIYLESLGLSKTPFFIIPPDCESLSYLEGIYSSGQWAIRSADKPDYKAEKEIGLPWGVANSIENLLGEIRRVRREAGDRVVFIHRQRNFEKLGGIRISPTLIEIEGFPGGDFRALVNSTRRGNVSPLVCYTYNPGMLYLRSCLGDSTYLTILELNQLRNVERTIEGNVSSNTRVVNVDFSVEGGVVDCIDIHGLRVQD